MVLEEVKRSRVDEMKDYLEKDIFPVDPQQAQELKKRFPRYVIKNETLYRRFIKNPLLRCVEHATVQGKFKEVHEGGRGGHPGVRTLADKIITHGYFWPSPRKDADEYVKR